MYVIMYVWMCHFEEDRPLQKIMKNRRRKVTGHCRVGAHSAVAGSVRWPSIPAMAPLPRAGFWAVAALAYGRRRRDGQAWRLSGQMFHGMARFFLALIERLDAQWSQ